MQAPLAKLTGTQKLVYEHIIEFLVANGYPPTLADIQTQFGYSSKNSAQQALDILAAKQYIILDGTPRGIRLTQFKIILEPAHV